MSLDIARLEESPHLIDLLIQMEDILDSLDVYVFSNWINGVIVAGPNVRRYWLGLTLEYPHDRKPDERAALRLIKHGLQCTISQGHKGERVKSASTGAEHDETDTVWLVELKIPRRLITDRNAGQLDFYDDEVDTDDVQDASDAGMTDETGYVDQGADAPPAPGGPEDMPGDAQQAPPKGANAPN